MIRFAAAYSLWALGDLLEIIRGGLLVAAGRVVRR